MMAPTHMLTAATATGLFLGPTPSLMLISVLSALMPDIDWPESKISRKIPFIPTLIYGIFGHRTLTHSLLVLGGFYLLITTFFSKPLAYAWVIGYGSHIILDIATGQGVMLFWPIPVWVKAPFMKTGSIIEYLFAFFLVAYNFGTESGRLIWAELWTNLTSTIINIIPFV